jgi:hypothetical protein
MLRAAVMVLASQIAPQVLAQEPPAALQLATVYVDELAAEHNVQQLAKVQAKTNRNNPNQSLMDTVRNTTTLQLSLAQAANALALINGSPELLQTRDLLMQTYVYKGEVLDDVKKNVQTFIAGTYKQDPSVNYGALTARAPENTARITDINTSLFKMGNLVFAGMLDMRPDKDGHVSHLTITHAQRKDLLGHIDSRFGRSLDNKDMSVTDQGAWLLRKQLSKSFKSSDEP